MNPSHQRSLMAYYVPGVVLGAGYMVANKTKSLSWWTLCSTGHRGHRPFSIAGGPSAEQGAMVEEAEEEVGSLFYVGELS